MSNLRGLFDLKDKVIIVTGAVGLLGRKHVEAIAAFGGHPVLLDLSPKAVASFTEEINAKYAANASGFPVDITDEDRIADNAVEVVERYGKIDGLVNNAANNPKVEDSQLNNCSRLENFSLDNWNEDIAVGLTGSFLASKHYGYQISKNKNGVVIVNISSDLGLVAPDQRLYSDGRLRPEDQPVKPVTYSVVKTGLLGLTRYLATYWADSNVRCNAICPGGVENGQSEAFIREVSSRIPLGRLAQLDEYQGILVWMLGNASKYLNGAIIPVDGGRTTW